MAPRPRPGSTTAVLRFCGSSRLPGPSGTSAFSRVQPGIPPGRKWNRLAEQGAVVARYVARADDGRVVRILEDMVTRETGLAQQVRSPAKAEALTERPGAELDALNTVLAAKVRAVLAQAAVVGFEVVEEEWVRPAQAAALCAPAARHAYPHALDTGQHGFHVAALCGPNALADLPGTEAQFVVNLGRLAARAIELVTSSPKCRPCRSPCSEQAR